MKVKVCKCDRCGRIFEPTMGDGEFFNKVILIGDQTFDLVDSVCDTEAEYDICDSCYEDFHRWFRRGKIKNKE